MTFVMDRDLHAATKVGKAVEVSSRRVLADVDRASVGREQLRLLRFKPDERLAFHDDGQFGNKFFDPTSCGNDELLRQISGLSGLHRDSIAAGLPACDRLVEMQ